jgi:hypothetical protein
MEMNARTPQDDRCDFSLLKPDARTSETTPEPPLFRSTPAKTINGLIAFGLILASVLILIAMPVSHAAQPRHVILFRSIYVGGTEQDARDAQVEQAEYELQYGLKDIQKMIDDHRIALVAPGHEITWDSTDTNRYIPVNIVGFSQVFYASRWVWSAKNEND